MGEKISRGGKIPFFAQKYQISSKVDLFSEKFIRQGRAAAPLCLPLGTPMPFGGCSLERV